MIKVFFLNCNKFNMMISEIIMCLFDKLIVTDYGTMLYIDPLVCFYLLNN